MTRVWDDDYVQSCIKKFKEDRNFKVEYDDKAGTITVHDGAICVLKGIQKARRGHWIVRIQESERVKWHDDRSTL